MKNSKLILLIIPFLFWKCHELDRTLNNTLFELVPSNYSGIQFINQITPSDSVNLLSYEYIYNGGGVAAGDLNNDGLFDLVFGGNMVPSTIYLNRGDLLFEDIGLHSGIQSQAFWATGITLIDINYDGLEDIYFCVGGPGHKSIYPNKLFINNGDLTFTEAAEDYGLNASDESIQATFLDYDLDGDLDMYLLNGGGFEKSAVVIRPIIDNGTARNNDRLFENRFNEEKGHAEFIDVTRDAGIVFEGFGLGVAVIDVNHDGWPDLYVSNDYISRDLLYVNNQDGTFSEQAQQYFGHLSHFSMGNTVGDVNNDGMLDIITLDMLPEDHYRKKMMFGPNNYDRFQRAVDFGYGHQYMRNMLHIQHGDNRYREVGQLAGIDKTDWSWCPLLADFDLNGYQDLYITNGYGKDITDLDYVKFRQSAHARFRDPEEIRNQLIASLADRPQIRTSNYAYRNQGKLTFEQVNDRWGINKPSISNGGIYVDLDQDGDLEIVTNNLDQEAFLFRNQLVEQNEKSTHFLSVSLQGPEVNRDGLGAHLTLVSSNQTQVRTIQRSRGFQSCLSPEIFFGLGNDSLVEQLIIVWPDGHVNELANIRADQKISVKYSTANESSPTVQNLQPWLVQRDLIQYEHVESDHNDFKIQPLLLHGFSRQGPQILSTDVNGNGRDDIFIGGAYGSPAKLYIQTELSEFLEVTLPTEKYEDLAACFLDVDLDQDLDLYIASGGSERFASNRYYQDRIYMNDGLGQFTLDTSRLPIMHTSTSTVASADYDQDGDLDLFVGGRVIPGAYPSTPPSYLLENRNGQFIDVTKDLLPELTGIGMVTDATWTDYNGDGRPDLIVVGEFMRIHLFENLGNRLINVTQQVNLSHTQGLWNCVESGDLDGDGDIDFLVGNIGQNIPISFSKEHPLRLHYADFDQNGSMDPIYSVYESGGYYPLASLDMMTQQLPSLKKAVLHYSDYAKSSTEDILQLLPEKEFKTLQCSLRQSVVLENIGGSKFLIHDLPVEAQVAPIQDFLLKDLNKDGLQDVFIVANDFQTEVVYGRYDAGGALLLLNQGAMNFESISAHRSGLQLWGDARSIGQIKLNNGNEAVIIGQNGGPLLSFVIAENKNI